METNKIQWRRISEGEELPCDSLLMRYDGTITRGTCAGVKAGQDAYYLPLYALKKLPKEESESEKIRKEIIAFVKSRGGFKSDWIAWIKKQGETFTKKDIEDAYLKGVCDAKHELENQGGQKPVDLVAILKNYFANTPKEQREKDWAELKHLNDVGFDAEIAFGAKDSDLQESTYFIPNGFHAEITDDKVVIKRGEQKPVDKIEPKFKAGKWYLCVKDFWGKFVRFDKGHAYYCGLNGCLKEFDSGAHIAIDEKLYDYFNLWTIQDAKDGDVLATDDWVFIFKELNAYGKPVCYCHYDDELGFKVDFNSYMATGSEIYPTIKEQRDTLEKAMADAGYAFDFEKKELRKIEQKSAWSERYIADVFEKVGLAKIVREQGDNNLTNALQSAMIELSKLMPQQKPWSEEDEKFFKTALWHISYSVSNGKSTDEHCDTTDWFKSLKDRVQTQSTWKPSKGQIEALEKASNEHWVPDVVNPLYTLLQDLKKLRGE